jgi:hypothetical protein
VRAIDPLDGAGGVALTRGIVPNTGAKPVIREDEDAVIAVNDAGFRPRITRQPRVTDRWRGRGAVPWDIAAGLLAQLRCLAGLGFDCRGCTGRVRKAAHSSCR